MNSPSIELPGPPPETRCSCCHEQKRELVRIKLSNTLATGRGTRRYYLCADCMRKGLTILGRKRRAKA